MSKPILCLDFDGVCHMYTSGWKGADVIPDDCVPGLFEFLEEAATIFDIQVFSSRSNQPGGIAAMQTWFGKQMTAWLFEHDPALRDKFESFDCPSYLSFPTEKPAAFLTIDDRAITFEGMWPNVRVLAEFKPWNKR